MTRNTDRVKTALRPWESGTSERQLNDAAVLLWRRSGVVQLELGHRRIVVENVSSQEMSALASRLRPPDKTHPVRPATLDELSALLDQYGFLTPRSADDPRDGQTPRPPAHLRPDLLALGTQFGGRAPSVLSCRRESAVAVHGSSRLAASVAATLGAAGVGWVQLTHGGDVFAGDACPGGLTPTDEGRRFVMAATDAVRRAAPDVDTSPIPWDRKPDLVILTDPSPVEPTVSASLHLDGLAHLVAAVEGTHSVIGPLVLPGISSCLRCADLHRQDRDPAWPAIAVQLGNGPRHRRTSDVALCVATAGIAVSQALAYLDRQSPATIEGTLEWQLPDWRLRRRSWPSHQACPCGAAGSAHRAPVSAGIR